MGACNVIFREMGQKGEGFPLMMDDDELNSHLDSFLMQGKFEPLFFPEVQMSDAVAYPHAQPVQYPVTRYSEQLYLEHALIVATHTVWKILVSEERDSFAKSIEISVMGEFEPFNVTHTETIPIHNCKSVEEFETQSKARRVLTDVPTWKAYHLPVVYDPSGKIQNSTYCIVLSKPQKWGSQMLPVKFFFRGLYENRNAFWEKYSSPAIMLTNSATKWYEKAFIILALLNLGYDPKVVSKLDARVRWEHFLAVSDLHLVGATGCQRKLSDNLSYLSPYHLESLKNMVQCKDGFVTLKHLRYFFNEAADGGIPPLKHIEALVLRYRTSWETGAIVGIIRSSVVKQFLLETNQRVGSFVLRIQYSSPGEICASSVQVNPQTGASFVDHLTISQHVAPDDAKLVEYLCSSAIHQIMLPMQKHFTQSVSTTSLGPSNTYRTTDQELQRTNQLLQQAYKEGFHGGRDPGASTPTPAGGFNLPSPQSPSPSSVPSYGGDTPVAALDENVMNWLRYYFQNESEQVLGEVIQKFARARVTANSLIMLDADDLKEMGIPIGPRKLLVRAIQQLNQPRPSPGS